MNFVELPAFAKKRISKYERYDEGNRIRNK